jgi:hypothetical protein
MGCWTLGVLQKNMTGVFRQVKNSHPIGRAGKVSFVNRVRGGEGLLQKGFWLQAKRSV